MATRRQHRINELILETLSLIIPGRTEDPRLADVQITRVETTQDMATAKVYFTCGDADDEAATQALNALRHGEGFLRSELADLGLRRLPHLVFTRDRQFESGERVLALLQRLREGGHVPDAAPPAADGIDGQTPDNALPDIAPDDGAADADALGD